jgi:hypothetical protein
MAVSDEAGSRQVRPEAGGFAGGQQGSWPPGATTEFLGREGVPAEMVRSEGLFADDLDEKLLWKRDPGVLNTEVTGFRRRAGLGCGHRWRRPRARPRPAASVPQTIQAAVNACPGGYGGHASPLLLP